MAKDIPECEDGCPFARCERNVDGLAADLCFLEAGPVALRLKRHLSDAPAVACQWWQEQASGEK